MSTAPNKIITINNQDYELVPFFDHDNQQWLYALRPTREHQ